VNRSSFCGRKNQYITEKDVRDANNLKNAQNLGSKHKTKELRGSKGSGRVSANKASQVAEGKGDTGTEKEMKTG
jgi:hypothetical protein